MKKILFLLLCTVSIYGQTTTGQEQEFDYGIKNNSTQTITTPPYLTTTGIDGTQGKIPSALIAKTSDIAASLATKENIANKSDSYTTSSSTAYVSGKALVEGLGTKENAFSKNTAFNKNFGTTAGTVAEGNDSRILNGQTSFGWGNHASAGYALTTGSNINQSSFRTALGLGSNAYSSTAYLPLTGGTLSGVVDFNQNATFNANALFNGSLFTDNVKPNTGNTLALLGGGANNLQVNGVATFSSTISATSYTGSATLTGTPTAPTAAPGTTGNQIATLDYVRSNSRPYKVYTALLSQTGTSAPTATVLENTTGTTITWTRNNTGIYVGTLGTGSFTLDKTFALGTYGNVNGGTVNTLNFQQNGSSAILLLTTVSGTLTDSVMSGRTSIEIRIYP